MDRRPTIFISYAHENKNEALELFRKLDIYADVFWDPLLLAGEFKSQLFQQVETRDFFLIIMSPYSMNSDWCEREYRHAELHQKKVIPALFQSALDSDLDQEIKGKYTYADFTKDHEQGFRDTTRLIFGEPFSSYERFAYESHTKIMAQLQKE